tara:strand:+ start:37 stop:921 length:885 start_codon:yes stop_codon:yes gene_type:complete
VRFREAHRWLSALAIWPGAYAAGAAAMLAQLCRVDLSAVSIAAAFCAGVSIFLLDRVKLRDALLDPADAIAAPERMGVICDAPRLIRSLAATLLLFAVVLGSGPFDQSRSVPAQLIGGATPLVAALGVVLYAGRPRGDRPRPKDRVLLKNAFVACGIVGLAAGLTVAPAIASGGQEMSPNLIIAVSVLAARVFADSALCDVEDTDADRAYGTRTLPRVLGNERARTLALALHTACGTALLALPATRTDAATAWGWSTIAVGVLLRVLPTDHLRDPVDAALGVQAVVVTVVLAAG